MSDTTYLLNLSTDAPKRQKLLIDGKGYELAVPEDFELEEFLELANAGSKASSLFSGGTADADPEETAKMKALLDRVVKQAIIDLPDEIFAKLKTVQKFSIVNVFSDAVTTSLGGGTSPPPETEQPELPGEKPSPDSSASMEEQSETG